jgi:hypothetical protein
MSIRSSADIAGGRPGNSEVYRQSFVEHVHELLAAGYSGLDRSVLRDQEEPAITGFLIKEIRRYIESSEAPAWAVSFAVHDDPPLDHPGTTGKRRPRVDIEMERVQRGTRPRFQFEAKRLHTRDSVREYLGEGGLLSFLTGRYAAEHEDAGMIGYVQAPPVHEWVARIQKRMEGARKELSMNAEGEAWRSRTDPRLQSSYESLHLRPGRPIRIHHTFLECC